MVAVITHRINGGVADASLARTSFKTSLPARRRLQSNRFSIIKLGLETCSNLVFLGVSVVGCGNRGSLVRTAPESTDASASETSNSSSSVDDASASSESASTPNGDEVANAKATDVTESPVSPARTSDAVEVISFDELNLGMPIDSRFRPIMLEYNDGQAKELLGKVVNLGGYMNPPDELRGLTEFVLLKNTECKFGPGGQADHLARVFMRKGTTVDYTNQVIYVEGRITLKPFPDDSPMTWSIYDIEAVNVSTRAPSRQR